jgi:hypothetical protein
MLDEGELKNIIDNLETLRLSGFSLSSTSSPLEPLLETLLELNFRLSKICQQEDGFFWKEKESPSIKELPKADELGNAKMVKVFGKSSYNPRDKKLAAFFMAQAEAIAFLIREHRLPKWITCPQGRSEPSKVSSSKKLKKNSNKKKKASSIVYYHRRHQRRTRNKR